MSDTNERSVASDGSVAGEPVAWAVWSPEWHEPLITFCPDAAEEHAAKWGQHAVPLYRNQPVTAHEREAIGVAIQCVVAAKAQRHPEEQESHELLHKTADTLRRLFDRTK